MARSSSEWTRTANTGPASSSGAVLEETGADNVGGPALTRAEGYTQRAIAVAFHSPFCVGGARFHDPSYEGPVDTVTYGCWKKKTLIRVGPFDEELVARNEDDEHNLRVRPELAASCGSHLGS